MKIIFIRGLPGTGKTIIAGILEKIFLDSKIICVDKFKLQSIKKNKSFEESNKIAHKKTLKKLQSLYEKGIKCVIVEELISNREFYNGLKDFINETESSAYWFRIMRPLKKLIEVESNRKRKIKNSEEDFKRLKEEIELIKIKEEIKIKNDNLSLTIIEILNNLALFS